MAHDGVAAREEHTHTNARTIAVAALATLALAACSSGSTSDSPTGASGTTPAATSTATASTPATTGAPAAAPTDFCASIAQIDGVDADLLAATGTLNAVIGASNTWNDPATITSLHETGQLMLDKIPAVTAFYDAAAGQVDDAASEDMTAVLSPMPRTRPPRSPRTPRRTAPERLVGVSERAAGDASHRPPFRSV